MPNGEGEEIHEFISHYIWRYTVHDFLQVVE
jgi:hypothetical protein